MQSTGQTSTQALSFTLMHGSAMMYGIRASRAVSSIWSDQALLTRRRYCVKHSGRFGPYRRGSLRPQPRIERVAERIAEQIEGEHGEADRHARENGHPGRRLGELDGRAAQHEAPGRRRLLHAEAEERQRRLGENRLP